MTVTLNILARAYRTKSGEEKIEVRSVQCGDSDTLVKELRTTAADYIFNTPVKSVSFSWDQVLVTYADGDTIKYWIEQKWIEL